MNERGRAIAILAVVLSEIIEHSLHRAQPDVVVPGERPARVVDPVWSNY
jgi:hypothetical protein